MSSARIYSGRIRRPNDVRFRRLKSRNVWRPLDVAQVVFEDSATVYLDLQPSSDELAQFAETAIVYVDVQPSSADVLDAADVAIVNLDLQASGTEQITGGIVHDAFSSPADGNSGVPSFSWSHNPVGVPRGVLIFVLQGSVTKTVTTVTYDGMDVPEVVGGSAIDTAGEPSRVDTFFLGSNVPTTDPATVVVNRTNNSVGMFAVAITVTSPAVDTEVYLPGIALLQENGTLAEQNVDDGSPPIKSVRYAHIYSGLDSPPGVGANSVSLHSHDFALNSTVTVREAVTGQGSRPIGFSSGTSDDRAAVHLAVRQLASVDAATVPLVLTPLGIEVGPTVDLATVLLDLEASGTDQFVGFFLDTATVEIDLQPSSVETLERQDAATIYLDLQASGTEALGLLVPWWDPLPDGENKWWSQENNKWREIIRTRFSITVRGRL